MAAAASFLEAPIPKPVLWVGTPIAAILLTGIFVFLGFPYDLLADAVAARASEATGTQVTIGGLEPRLTIAGPGFTARNVTLTPEQGEALALDKLKVRPAWSLSWLRGAPAIHIDVGSQLGNAHGDLVLGSAPGWDGEFTNLDLSAVPIPGAGDAEWTGLVDSTVNVVLAEDGPVGSLRFEGAEGSVAHPQLPFEIEFESLRGSLTLGGESRAEIEEFELRGPLVVATAQGSVKRGNRPGVDLLDVDVVVQVQNPGLRTMLQQFGVPLGADGRAEFGIGGTTLSPRMR